MSALIDRLEALDAAEHHRRVLLAESDALLDQVEELRLAGRPLCPPALADAIRALQLRLGRLGDSRARTVRTAHHLLFALQARLMADNPRNPHPRSHADRPAGAPRLAVLHRGGAWKFLALPCPPPGLEPPALAEWAHLVQLTVLRALDRWRCAQGQAVAAARAAHADVSPLHALHRAQAAWRNYWDLSCEADVLLARLAPSPAARAPRETCPPRAP